MGNIMVRVIDAYVYRYAKTKLKFLTLKRSKTKMYEHLWQGVAGKIEDGETASQAAIRELKEETQITLPTEPKFLYKIERPIEKGGNFMYVFHYESDKELKPTLDHEHTDFGYYKKDEMPEDIYYLRKFLK